MKSKFNALVARGGGLLILAAAGLAASGAAHAAGTAAGVTITNDVRLNYSVGTVNQPELSASAAFVVDRKIDHVVLAVGGAAVSVVPGQTTAVLNFTVANNGNAAQDYKLAFAHRANPDTVFGDTDNFDASNCQIRVGGTVQDYLVNVAATGVAVPVTITCDIPAGRANADVSGLTLTATAAKPNTNGGTIEVATVGANTAAEDIVFADDDGIDDGLRDGISSARHAYKVQTAVLAITKAMQLVCDPVNGNNNPKAIPGAFVKYTVTITNNGSATAKLTTITDQLSTNVTFDDNMIQSQLATAKCHATNGDPTSVAGAGFRVNVNGHTGFPKFFTTTSDADGITHAARVITVNFATVLPVDGVAHPTAGELGVGETLTLEYQVSIN